MENLAKILPLNSSSQNELMAWDCLKHSQIGNFKKLLQNGMPLTEFMLTLMVYFDYDKQTVKEMLIAATKRDKNIIKWMQNYFEIGELAEVLPLYEETLCNISCKWPANDDCVRLKLWDLLCQRREFNLVAQNAPEYLQTSNWLAFDDAWVALMRTDFAKYAPLCLERSRLTAFLAEKDWWKYLVDNGKPKWLLSCGAMGGLLPQQEIIDYCLQQGFADTLYELKMYDELLSREQLDVFVKNHSFYTKFLTEYPEKVDWEDLWKHCDSKEKKNFLKKSASDNKQCQKCHDFLLAHSGFWGRLSLF